MEVGIVPVYLLYEISNVTRYGSSAKLGKVPSKVLFCSVKDVKLVTLRKSFGRVPVSLLLDRSRVCNSSMPVIDLLAAL
jgi:hypothetical protein